MIGSPARLLRELVAFASPSGSEAEIAAFAAAELAAAGLDVERLGDGAGTTVLARLERGAGARVLFNSHLDTVPPGEGWSVPATGGDWQAGRLTGRGANDAKASVAAMVCAFAELARDPRPLRRLGGELWLALTACEETTHAGMAAVLARLGRPDGAVTGEPTGLEVVRAQAGLAVLRACWSGRACHAAHVARLAHDNALLCAAREVLAAGPYLTVGAEHALLGTSTLVPTVLHAGERHNVVPDRAEALFDCRLVPGVPAEAARALLAARMPSAEVEIRSARLAPCETSADHPLVRAALAAAGRAAAVGSPTLSDMALLAGVPAVKCGPGDTARSHTADEYVLLGELEDGHAFYRVLAPLALEALAPASTPR
jgi:acetylornithine deacetylase